MKKIGSWFVPDAETQMVREIEQTDGWQLDRLDQALKHVKDFEGLAIDVGAHVGIWSVALAERFSGVAAFEPSAENRSCLQMNLEDRLLVNVAVFGLALGAEPGLYEPMDDDVHGPGNTGGRWLRPSPRPSLVHPELCIQVRPLDEIWLTSAIRFVKIDAEGMEGLVIQGALETLVRHRPVICWEDKPRLRARHPLAPDPRGLLTEIGATELGGVGDDRVWGW